MNNEFLQQVKCEIAKAVSLSDQLGRPLVSRKTETGLLVADLLTTPLCSEAIEVLGKCLNLRGRPETVGDFIRAFRTVTPAIKAARAAQEFMKIFDQPEYCDFCKELEFALVLTRVAIEKSRSANSERRSKPIEYCVLCWRLVAKYEHKNYANISGINSSYYCAVHHPSKNDYGRAVRNLENALKRRGRESDKLALKRIADTSSKNRIVAPLYSEPSRSFARPVSKKNRADAGLLRALKKKDGDKEDWRTRRAQLLWILEKRYWYTYSIVSKVESGKCWDDWFFAVINELDPTRSDASNWKFTIKKDEVTEDNHAPKGGDSESQLNGWAVLLSICHSHESAKIISLQKEDRRRKTGGRKKDPKLLEAIKKEVRRVNALGGRLNAEKIGRKLGVSGQTIRNRLKDLKIK